MNIYFCYLWIPEDKIQLINVLFMSGLSFDVKDRTCLFFLEKMRNVFQEIEMKYCVTLHCKALARFELISTIWNLPKQLLLCLDSSEICNLEAENDLYMTYMVLWTWIDTTILIQCPRCTCYHFILSTIKFWMIDPHLILMLILTWITRPVHLAMDIVNQGPA